MKIAIVSINAHTKVLNFASPLHSYAFWKFLQDHGIDSVILDYYPAYFKNYDVRHPLFWYIDHPTKDAAKQKKRLKKWKTLFYERERRYDRFAEFIDQYYCKTEKAYTAKTIETDDPGFDCYICATDVIWKWEKGVGFDRCYFLAADTFKGKKKIAYAASKGPKTYSRELEQKFFEYVSDFDYISVRERSLQEYITQHSDLPVTHVLDPVFLQEKEFYQSLAKPSGKKGYVLLYIVMETATDLVKNAAAYAQAHGLELIELSDYPENANIPAGTHHDVIYDIGIEEWLGYLLDADYIFTNSFHACCFSIIFGKQFVAGARSGDKIDSLLELFQLTDRRIPSVDADRIQNLPAIDYAPVEALLRTYKQSSEDFILNAIHDMERSPHQNSRELVHADVFAEEGTPAADAKKASASPNQKKSGFFSRLKKLGNH